MRFPRGIQKHATQTFPIEAHTSGSSRIARTRSGQIAQSHRAPELHSLPATAPPRRPRAASTPHRHLLLYICIKMGPAVAQSHSHFKKQIKSAGTLPAYRPIGRPACSTRRPPSAGLGLRRTLGTQGIAALCAHSAVASRRDLYTSLIPTPARAKSSRVGSQSGRSRTAEPGTTTVASTSGRSHFAVRVDVPSPPITRFSLSPKRM